MVDGPFSGFEGPPRRLSPSTSETPKHNLKKTGIKWMEKIQSKFAKEGTGVEKNPTFCSVAYGIDLEHS